MIYKIKIFTSLFFLIIGYLFFYAGFQNINVKKISELSNNISVINPKNILIENEIEEIDSISNIDNKIKKEKKISNNYKEYSIKVKKNQTFLMIIKNYISDKKLTFDIINEIEKYYNLRKLKFNQEIFFYKNISNNNFEIIKIPIENDKNLIISLKDQIKVELVDLISKSENQSKEYVILSSLFEDGVKNNIPVQILSKLIRLYSFDLDFQRDIRKNTKVSISYETILIEDRKDIFYGEINYALIEIEKNKLEYFKFITDEDFVDYFNRKGENVKKSLLKTPLDGAKLSSGFDLRKHPISGYNKMHKGLDFAAPTGTPIYAAGNGIIEFVGRNGGYGKYIRIRHNNEYKTAYAHLSGYKKGIGKGIRVNQGDIIGYVGNTGNSTGPHLHYEIIYQNKQINPLKLKLPSGRKLKGAELERFLKIMKAAYADHLHNLYE